MSQIRTVSQNGSFVQDQRHLSKSEKFVAVQPSQIATVLNDHGFDLVHLKTGRAKLEDRQNHQTTIARYRSRDAFGVDGAFFDLLFKVPHLYGAIEARLGFFRGVCANAWNSGRLVERAKIRHVGDTLQQIDTLIPFLVSQREAMVDQIRLMQSRNVTPDQLAYLAKEVAHLRLRDALNNVTVENIQYNNLITPRRQEDTGSDLYSVINVLQENVMRFGLRYQTVSQDENGISNVRNLVARPVMRNRQGEIESVRSMDLNGSIWELAQNLLKTA